MVWHPVLSYRCLRGPTRAALASPRLVDCDPKRDQQHYGDEGDEGQHQRDEVELLRLFGGAVAGLDQRVWGAGRLYALRGGDRREARGSGLRA